MVEEWKTIPCFQGLYEASNLGRIRSIDRVVRRNGLTSKSLKGKILSPNTQKNGYKVVALSKQGKTQSFRVHRLVALAWLPNPDNLTEVNHLNENKADNSVANLSWVSHRENANYGTRIRRCISNRDQSGVRNGMFGKIGGLNPNAKEVIKLSMDGDFIAEYPSLLEASKSANCTRASIRNNIKGRTKHCGGYKWMYKQDFK